jgi:hypothetical protein
MSTRVTIQNTVAAMAIACLAACANTSAPADETATTGGCVTDFSCPYGEECQGTACGSLAPTLYPNIQTASCLLRAPLDADEIQWRAVHYDLVIGHVSPDEMRAVNPNIRIFEYSIPRFHRFDGDGAKTEAAWATAHGYDPENFYLHYKEDVNVPTWGGIVLVPGFPAGTVPGWNPGGGGNPASATERSQSRVVAYNGGGPPWYLSNVADPGFKRFLADYAEQMIDGRWYTNTPFASGPIDGILCDDALYYPQFGEGQLDHTAEYYGIAMNDQHPYAVAIETMFPTLAQNLMDHFGSTKDVMPNYGHVYFLNYPERSAINVQKTTPWIWGEVWLTYTGVSFPTSGGSRCVTYDADYENAIHQIVYQTRARGRRIIGARDTSNGTAGSDRGKIFTLALYYLVHGPYTYYMYETGPGHWLPGHLSTWAWNPAVEYDVGQPDLIPNGSVDFDGHANTKEYYVFASGSDPYDSTLTYRVLARNFTNALVLVKMLPAGSVTDDRSITTHPLNGSYAVLQADGSLGAVVTEATLRNNEAQILIRL